MKTLLSDDLERFFDDLRNNKIIISEAVSFFTPKLTDEELALVEDRNQQHLDTYSKHYDGKNPDVDTDEMKKSDSKSKYAQGHCYRRTIALKLESKQNEKTENDLSDTKRNV